MLAKRHKSEAKDIVASLRQTVATVTRPEPILFQIDRLDRFIVALRHEGQSEKSELEQAKKRIAKLE